MTATSSTNKPAKPSGVAQSAKTDVKIPEDGVQIPGINRREFLFYMWGASMALFTASSVGVIIWYMLPKFKEGEFGGVFPDNPVPTLNAEPINNPTGKYWLAYSDEGIVALYKVCTHLGCLYAWVGNNNRFECPCHGSKFELSGRYIEGPAPRSLDRFEMTIKLSNGSELVTNESGDPISGVSASDIQQIIVDTGKRIKRDGKV